MLKTIRYVAIALIAAGALGWGALWLRGGGAARLGLGELGFAVPGGVSLGGPFTLVDTTGATVTDASYRGRWMLIYFGYTYCPDFCPTTLAKLRQVREGLGDDAGRMQAIMISVDPGRDTPDLLGRYVAAFDPTFVGLTGTPDEIDAVGDTYGLFYEIHEGSAATGYLIDHSTRTYLIGPDGRALVAYPHDATVDAIVADLRWLLEQES